MIDLHELLSLLFPLLSVQVPRIQHEFHRSARSSSWRISNFEWRTGSFEYTLVPGVGPSPYPPTPGGVPPPANVCGAAMVRMNITSTDIKDLTIECIEETSDIKLSNITDPSQYDAGPSGTPPASPHWFVCGGSQLFIYPTGKGNPWGDAPPEPEWQVINGHNVSTKIQLDSMERTLSVTQALYCDDYGGRDGVSCVEFNATGSAKLPQLECRERTVLEPDANITVNSPVMGPSVPLPLFNGNVCTGPEFTIVGSAHG
ncbi:hypothetical protein F5B20DRAFT_574925 [Whalleya microplaca]|nr:hypothetical protein F5B20DRAFT_574925 [Whalleya microplaca]